jgi:hypothetical protein
LTVLTANHGDLEAAFNELSKTQLKPFLMRIWGPPVGTENEAGNQGATLEKIRGEDVENQRADKEMAKAVSPIDNGKDRAPPTTEQTPIVKEVPPDELKKTQNFELLDNIESEVLKNLQDINKLSDSLETNNEPKSTKPKVYVEKSSTVIQVVDHDYEVPEAERDEKRIESDFSDTESSDEGNRVEEFVDAVSEVHPVGLAPLKRKSVSTLNITLASTGEPGESATGVPISVVKNSTEVKMIQPSESTREDVVVESTAAIQLQSAPPKNGDVGASEVKAEQKRDLEASTKQDNTATSLEIPPVLADSDKEKASVMPSVEQDGGLLASGVEKNVESTSTVGGVEENKNVELADGTRDETNLLENERQSVETGLKEKLGVFKEEKMTEGGVGGGEIAADVTSVDLESCTMSEDVKNENNAEIVANLIVAQEDVRGSVADVKEELNEDVGADLGTCEVESDQKRNVLVEENATKAEKNGDSEKQIGQRKSASPRPENDRCRKVRPKEVVSSEKKDLSRSGKGVEVVSQSVEEVKEEKAETTEKPVENKPPLTKKQKKSMKRAKRRSQRRAARRGSTSTTESSSCEKPSTETDSEPNQKEALKEVHEEVKNSEDKEAKPRDVTSEQPKTDAEATASTDLPENVEIHPKISTTVQIAQNKQSLLPVPPKRPSRIPISRQRSISKSEPKSPDVHTASKIPIKTGSQIPVKNKQHNNIDHTGEGGSVNNSQTGESPGEVVQTSEDKPSGSAEEIVGRSGSAAKDEGVEVEEAERPQRPCVQRDKSEEIEQEMKQSVQAIKELNRQLNTNSKSKKGSLGSFRNSSVESTTSSKQLSYTKSLDNDSDSSVSDSNVEELLDPSTDEDSYEDFEEYDEVEESDTEDYNEFDRKNARIVDELDINLSQISAKVEKLTTDLTDNKNDYLDEVCESEEYSSEEEEEEEAEDESDNKFDVSIEVKQPSEIEVMEVRP